MLEEDIMDLLISILEISFSTNYNFNIGTALTELVYYTFNMLDQCESLKSRLIEFFLDKFSAYGKETEAKALQYLERFFMDLQPVFADMSTKVFNPKFRLFAKDITSLIMMVQSESEVQEKEDFNNISKRRTKKYMDLRLSLNK